MQQGFIPSRTISTYSRSHLQNNGAEPQRRYSWHDIAGILPAHPLDEDAHRSMMRFLASSGQVEEALFHYKACRDVLRRELGVEPELATEQLAEQFRQLQTTPIPPIVSPQQTAWSFDVTSDDLEPCHKEEASVTRAA